jgi:hypothetical protein
MRLVRERVDGLAFVDATDPALEAYAGAGASLKFSP